ncbi:MAG: DUF4230 domain-containing protein [Prevotella sp.]|jgi:hypothetical protein|nr:DUF4230 domain-containing protein [Prevotella sp.]
MNRILLYLLSVFIGLSSCSRGDKAGTEVSGQPVDTLPELIMHVQQCSRIYTAEYRVRKIVTHDDVIRLRGTVFQNGFDIRLPLGERKIAIPMTATIKAYINLGGFSEDNVKRDGRRVTIILPDPVLVLTGSEIDHKNVKEFVALTRSHFSDEEMSDFAYQGRKSIIASIARMGVLDTARENAARILIPMLEQLGYSSRDITVTFNRRFTDSDIVTMVDNAYKKEYTIAAPAPGY